MKPLPLFHRMALADAVQACAEGLCQFPTGGSWRSLTHTGRCFGDETMMALRNRGYLAFSPDGRRMVITEVGRAVHEKMHKVQEVADAR